MNEAYEGAQSLFRCLRTLIVYLNNQNFKISVIILPQIIFPIATYKRGFAVLKGVKKLDPKAWVGIIRDFTVPP